MLRWTGDRRPAADELGFLRAAVQSAGDRPTAAVTRRASVRHGAPMRNVPHRV